MAHSKSAILDAVKRHVLEEFLPGEAPSSLTATTPLITGSILDSIATLKLVSFLEETYGIQFQAHEINVDYLDTLDTIAETVTSKLDEQS